MTSSDTICALSSAPGRAGVAVVRVSGPRARLMLEALAGRVPKARTATVRTIRSPDTGQDIDRAIVLLFPGPSSFTGEDVAEVHTHGGRAVVESVLGALGVLGCRLAEPGEFARRAFENGKIDLTEAEGIADLIDAETEAQRQQAVRQASGALFKLYEGWRQEIVTAMALTEAAIDFSDEADVATGAMDQARDVVADLMGRLLAHLGDGRRGEILRDGFRVVIAGPPNAGKSSLLNALARRDVAIVSPEAGTTRDVIEVRLDLEGIPVIVSDTAGIREALGAVELEGIRRTLERGRDADLVIWMTDGSQHAEQSPPEKSFDVSRILRVESKADLHQPDLSMSDGHLSDLRVSAVTGQGMADLVSMISERARARIGSVEDVAITRARHREAIEDCVKALGGYLEHDGQEAELCAEELRLAANALGRVTGKVDAEMVLGEIFGRFCIGK